MKKITTATITASKGQRKIACLTAADYATAKIIDRAGLDLIMVGDSLAMTRLGHATTLPVTVDEMIMCSAAVARGVARALIVTDMPFLSYQVSKEDALANAGRLLKEGFADAVKLEGGSIRKNVVQHLVANGIPVMGHIGLTPQSVHEMGGYKVQGKTEDGAKALLADAQALEEAGVFSIVLEAIPRDVAKHITEALSIPTIGIGAGPDCDGQILVVNDMLGITGDAVPKFVKRYADLDQVMQQAFETYRDEVTDGNYPDEDHSY